MLKTHRNVDVEELGAGITSAFQKLLGLLKVPVPVVTALSVSLMLGATTVKIQSLELPIVFAPFASIVLMLVIYIGCAKAAVTMVRLFQAIRFSENYSEVDRQSIAIKSEASLLNPFSSTKVTTTSDDSVFDYTGLILILLPAAAILITSTWVLYDANIYAAEVIEGIEDGKYKERLDEGLVIANFFLGNTYFFFKFLFIIFYGYFLITILQVSNIVNSDFHVRLAILTVPFAVIVVSVVIIDLTWITSNIISVTKLVYGIF